MQKSTGMQRTETATITTEHGTEHVRGTAREVNLQVERAVAHVRADADLAATRVEVTAGALHALLKPRRNRRAR